MISKLFLITKALYVPLMACVQENLGRSVGPPSSSTSLESDNQVRYSKVSVGHFDLSGWDACGLEMGAAKPSLAPCILPGSSQHNGRASYFQIMASSSLFSEWA